MATYNGAKYLAEQLDSTLSQDYPNIEIVIVDDCSSDNTWNILNDYRATNSNIYIYKNLKNMGVVKTFERAISLTHGEYIALSDQDDIWLPHKLTTLLNEIGDNWLIHSDAVLINADKQEIQHSFSNSMKKISRNNLANILIGNTVTGCTCFIAKQLLSYALPFPKIHIHDHYLAIVAASFNKLAYCNHALILYRQHSNNTLGTNVRSYKQWHNVIKKYFFNDLLTVPALKDFEDIKFTIEYFDCLKLYHWPSYSLVKWCIKNFGWLRFCGFVLKGPAGKVIAQSFYSFRIKFIVKRNKLRYMP